jgi:5-methylcytosine-specific restriction endonuclease McrA
MTTRTNLNGSNWLSKGKRDAIWKRQGGVCIYCGEAPKGAKSRHIDHVIARNLGGINHEAVLAGACGRCNDRKGAMPIEQWLSKHSPAVRARLIAVLSTPLNFKSRPVKGQDKLAELTAWMSR